MALVKAKLISSDGGGTIEFMFNPNQLAFQRQISLNKNVGARTGKGLPKVNFAYPEPCVLNINDILLDTYEEGNAKSVITLLVLVKILGCMIVILLLGNVLKSVLNLALQKILILIKRQKVF